MRYEFCAEKSLLLISPLKPRKIEQIREAIIQEIAATTECASRGITRERAVKRKIKPWNIKQDFSSKTAPHDYFIT